jgi:hypothetical protein
MSMSINKRKLFPLSSTLGLAALTAALFSTPLLASAQSTQDLRVNQRYLMGPEALFPHRIGGVNVLPVRNYEGGDGSQSRILIVAHHRWMFTHPDLPQPYVDIEIPWEPGTCQTVYYGDRKQTGLAGLLVAKDNGVGVTGIAPAAELGSAEFSWGNDAQFARITASVKAGDVVVYPHPGVGVGKVGNYDMMPGTSCPRGKGMCTPMHEYFPETAAQIQYLTDMGVHVVVDGGFGGANLDDPQWGGAFDRDQHDSGAIYVGRVSEATGARQAGTAPLDNSNYGSRIDLAGWQGNPNRKKWSTEFTDGPWGSPDGYGMQYDVALGQVAGVVALVQSVATAHGIEISPKEMRTLLVETARELPNADPSQPIGKYPDAEAAVKKLLEQRGGNAGNNGASIGIAG